MARFLFLLQLSQDKVFSLELLNPNGFILCDGANNFSEILDLDNS